MYKLLHPHGRFKLSPVLDWQSGQANGRGVVSSAELAKASDRVLTNSLGLGITCEGFYRDLVDDHRVVEILTD